MTTAAEMRDALVKQYHERSHEDGCECPASFVADPLDALIAQVEAETSAGLVALAVGWVAYMHGYASTNTDPTVPYQHRGDWTECPWHPCRQAAAILAALPAPEPSSGAAPVEERCAVTDCVGEAAHRSWTVPVPGRTEPGAYCDHEFRPDCHPLVTAAMLGVLAPRSAGAGDGRTDR